MSTTQPLPPTQPTNTNGVANVDTANKMVSGNQTFVAHSPDLAAAGVSSGNQDTFTTLAAMKHTTSVGSAIDDHVNTYNSGSWISNIFKDVKEIPGAIVKGVTDLPVVGKAIGTVLNWANKPLQEIQKDYKFIHSLYTDQGPMAGIIGTAAVIAGGALGTFVDPGAGTALGAEAGAAFSRNILGRVLPNFKSSLDKSNNPDYLVSFGRDVAHLLSNVPGFGTLANTNTGLGQIVSGISDAAFDFEGDPLATAGKLKAQIRRGDNIAVAVDPDNINPKTGNPMPKLDPITGKPVAVRATLPFASSATGLQNFFLSNSLVVHSSDQLDMALANPLMKNVNRAIDDIAAKAKDPKTGLADITNTYGVKNGWSRAMNVALSKVENREQVVQIFKQALYSKELADNAEQSLADLKLPTKSVGKLLSEKIGADRIKQSAQGSTWNEQTNLLLPKKSAIMDPVVNADGTPAIDPKTGLQQTTARIDPTTGEMQYKINKPLWAKPNKENIMNALAGKVRTFTGQRPLSFDMDNMALSSKEIDFADPNVGKTIYDIAYMSMPHRIALERTTDILTSAEEDQLAKLHTLHQEVLKNFGLGDTQASTILGQQKDAIVGNPADHGVYGFNNGRAVGAVDVKPEFGGDSKSMAIVQGQRYKGAMLDLKEIRSALRQAKAYGVFYNKADDFFTHYTNVIFAPLALLSPAFGLRVSTGEALHQVMRRGLPSYLNNLLATSLRNMDKKYQAYHNDAVAQGLTPTDLDASEREQATGIPQVVKANEVTKELDNRENVAKRAWQAANKGMTSKTAWNDAVNNVANARYKVMPVGWVAGKFKDSKVGSYLVGDKVKYLDEMHRELGVDGTPAGISSAHQASQDLYSKEQIDLFTKTLGHGSKPGQELAGLQEFDPHFHDYWAKGANMAAADMAQRDIARAYINASKDPAFKQLTPNQQFASLVDGQVANIKNPNMYKEYRSTMDGYTKATPESFAKAQVDYLQGIVHGSDGTVHTDLIQKIAKGEQVTGKELRKLPNDSAPIKVLGRRQAPTISDSLRRVEEIGYRKFVNPVMDWVSRNPLFADFYTRRRQTNQTLIDMGLVDPQTAVRMSALQATREMIPAIHSPAIRSQFAVLHRNLLPFYFAQEQAMRRTGRLIMTNPQAFRDFQIVNQGLNNPGFVHTDANGTKYIVYPGLGEFGNAVSKGLNALGVSQFTGLPSSITGNTSSLLTVLPEVKLPGTSPFINLGLSQLDNLFPWMSKVTNVASGGYPSKNWIDTIIPNSTMRDLFNSMNMDDRESMVYNSKLSAIMAAYYHGDLPDNYAALPPYEQAKYLAKIEHNAQSNLIVKGLLSFFLPLSPTVSNDYYTKNLQTLRSEYLNLLKQPNPATGKPDAAWALDKFLQETGSPTNPNRGLSYTVAHTTSGTGAYAPLADSTLSWIKNNQSLLNNSAYSSAAPYLIPQTGDSADALQVENQLLANHFRAKISSQDFMTALYVKKGWQDLAKDSADYQAAMKVARTSGNRYEEYQLSQIWKTVTSNYGQSNPIWFADYNNPTRLESAKNALQQFQVMNTKGLIPDTVEGKGIKDLLTSYEDYHKGLLANTYGGKHLPGYANLQDVWYSYLDNLAQTNPRLQSVITSVFRRAV